MLKKLFNVTFLFLGSILASETPIQPGETHQQFKLPLIIDLRPANFAESDFSTNETFQFLNKSEFPPIVPRPRHTFTSDEDLIISGLAQQATKQNKNPNWYGIALALAKLSPPNTPLPTSRQIRDRFNSHLSYELKNPWTPEEDECLLNKYDELGPKYNQIALFFPSRDSTAIYNRLKRLLNDQLGQQYANYIKDSQRQSQLRLLKEIADTQKTPRPTVLTLHGFELVPESESGGGHSTVNLGHEDPEVRP